MKKIKFFSLILALILVFNITVPIACAASATNGATAQMNAPVTDGNYTMSGAETSDVRFNILINNTNQTGQFALVYLKSPDYVYEFTFNLDAITSDISNINFSDIQAYCFDNESQWKETYLPDSVSEVQFDENQPQPYAADHNITYFRSWLIDKYGHEYEGNLLTTKTQNGTTMYLKFGFQIYVDKDKSYLIHNTMTVVGFVTAVLGLTAGASVVGVLGLIAGADGLLHMGESVYEYRLRAGWLKYATVVSGSGYPYALTNKFTYYKGFYYTKTGKREVDTDSESTSYIPSSSVYNSHITILNNAFDEYDRIGFQNGDFP
ncbi:hypothetical protein [Flavonifractor sp. AGMB03687]|uniref:hypothetical protein n=1 Tax=Flavonifractor sp. AGMB03687 TaxID=2785133 RepID=UPI001AE02FCA|nr:hypothetical protein [Flavonifractor sp. AGMB03687]